MSGAVEGVRSHASAGHIVCTHPLLTGTSSRCISGEPLGEDAAKLDEIFD